MKIVILSSFAFLACGPSSPSTTPATGNVCGGDPCAGDFCAGEPCGDDPCGGDPCGGDPRGGAAAAAPDTATGVDWTQWQSWTKVNASTFESKGHQKVMVDVYVPADHVDSYKNLKGEMPQGFAVVKAQYNGADAASGVKNITVMAKMAPGFDDDNGNWYYGALSADGATAMTQGTPEMCVSCHAGSKTDHVFGAPK